jgi:hypothetical protein
MRTSEMTLKRVTRMALLYDGTPSAAMRSRRFVIRVDTRRQSPVERSHRRWSVPHQSPAWTGPSRRPDGTKLAVPRKKGRRRRRGADQARPPARRARGGTPSRDAVFQWGGAIGGRHPVHRKRQMNSIAPDHESGPIRLTSLETASYTELALGVHSGKRLRGRERPMVHRERNGWT